MKLEEHYAAIRRAETNFEAQTDMPRGMLRYLLALRHGKCYVGDLGERVGVTQQATGKMITILEEHNLARRIVDKADRRGRYVSITPTGLRMLEAFEMENSYAA